MFVKVWAAESVYCDVLSSTQNAKNIMCMHVDFFFFLSKMIHNKRGVWIRVVKYESSWMIVEKKNQPNLLQSYSMVTFLLRALSMSVLSLIGNVVIVNAHLHPKLKIS